MQQYDRQGARTTGADGGVCRLAAVALGTALLAACARLPPPPPPPSAGALCLAELDRRGIAYQPAVLPASTGSCIIDNPVKVTAAGVPWNQPGTVSCGFALTLDTFTRREISPLAQAYFKEPVRELLHFGTYACRTTKSGHWSAHATGTAIDIAGVVLADGRVIKVIDSWRDPGPAGAFLHAVARAACRDFKVVLTPDSNADHVNHLHFDSGPYPLCGA